MYEEERMKELVERYNLDLAKLAAEQIKLAKNLSLKDNINFSLAERIAGIDCVFLKNRIISAIVVLQNGEVIEQEYAAEKTTFPYIPEYESYRFIPSMIQAFQMLDETPDIVFIHGGGILHPRGLGIASHFSLAANVPTLGITESFNVGSLENDNILYNGKIIGQKVQTKLGSNPIFVSPGNLISLKSAVELTKRFVKEPHKLPEPLRLAKKYSREVLKELQTDEFPNSKKVINPSEF